MEVTRIYLCVQFTPLRCFESFGQEVTECRRKEDASPGDHTILADTMKLLGNSGYGKTITNKDKFTRVSFCNTSEALGKINGVHFKNLQTVTKDLYEVEEFKVRVVQDLPLQIGFFVYQEAKLRMLQFYYDFVDKFVDRRDFQYCQMDTDSGKTLGIKHLCNVYSLHIFAQTDQQWNISHIINYVRELKLKK